MSPIPITEARYRYPRKFTAKIFSRASEQQLRTMIAAYLFSWFLGP